MLADSPFIQFTRRTFVTTLALTAAGLTGNYMNAESNVQKSQLSNRFLGVWRYRSFRNVTDVAQKLDDILFWEAELSLNDKGDGHVEGMIGDASDKLNVRGSS